MASYKILWKKSAQKELYKLNKELISKVLEFVAHLSENPYPDGCLKLRGSHDAYRYRIGDYRIIYTVLSNILTIEIIRIGHRKEIYRRFT